VAWHSSLQFNVHPLCMVLGMVFLQGDALLVYRVFRHEAKRSTKALHALLHGLALVIALVGGFFLLPGASFSLRSRYKPQHIFFGIALFALSITACLLGITEMLLFNIRDSYSHFWTRPTTLRRRIPETWAHLCRKHPSGLHRQPGRGSSRSPVLQSNRSPRRQRHKPNSGDFAHRNPDVPHPSSAAPPARPGSWKQGCSQLRGVFGRGTEPWVWAGMKRADRRELQGSGAHSAELRFAVKSRKLSDAAPPPPLFH
ncbi:PREDICTED: cytochrome b reductase 1, partial [Leptosomus discolor]|uniref:cytochrome b reductase 1 n=1 Tax=Leptosomus discolor TaxID=188344 RepID=UPI00052240B0